MSEEDARLLMHQIRTDPGGAAVAAFFLGVRAAEAANNLPTCSTQTGRLAEVLVAVAKGEETFVPSGAEIRLKHADAPADIEAIRGDNQKSERLIAELVARSMKK